MSEHNNVPPQNLDAEESVLGALLLNKNAITDASDILRKSDFYRESHGIIFDAALDLDAKGETVDAITLAAELDRRGVLGDIGGKFRIHELASVAPATANTKYYAKIVREMATRRALVRAGAQISELGWEGIGDPSDLIATADAALSAVSDGAAGDDSDFAPLEHHASALVDEVVTAAEEGRELFGVKTGIPSLDNLTAGFHPGQLIVVAGRPGMGKSVFGQTVATNVSDRNEGSLIFTLEMSSKELATRWLAKLTNISTTDIARAKLNVEQRQKLRQAMNQIEGRPLATLDNAGITLPELRARARRHIRKHPNTKLLVVDYLQLMVTGGDEESKQQEIAKLSRGLKLLAKELHIPVVALSQLNRAVESRTDKRPNLADLRDSGAIEQDADVVMFLYRESKYKQVPVEKENDAELIVAKNRMGESRTINLLFLARRQMFTETPKGES